MKLRNKKTGEIVDVESLGHANSLKEKYGYQVTLSWRTEYENLSQCKEYNSLAELNNDWEDYKPAEPLIKDEKVRKAVKAWAEANGDDCYHIVSDYRIDDGIGYSIEFYNDPFDGLEKRHYTIRELCGDD